MNTMLKPQLPPIENQVFRRFVLWWVLFSAAHYAVVMAASALLVSQAYGILALALGILVKVLSMPIELLTSSEFYQHLKPAYLITVWILNSLLWGAAASGVYEWIKRRNGSR